MRSALDPVREQTLVEQSRHHSGAFRELYLHYFSRVYAYVSYRVGRAQDAEDLVSETFLKVVEKIEHFQWRGEGTFAAWIFRIASNVVSDFYRQGRQWKESVPLEELPELESSNPLPTDTILQKEEFNRLRRLIGTLSPRRQEVITLKFFGGLRNREIAEILGLSERTVASHLCRGLEELHWKYMDGFIPMKTGDHDERAE